MRRRGDTYRQELERKIQAARQAESTTPPEASPPSPDPDPAAGFSDPGIRAELLADQLSESRRELQAERAARQQAQARLAELEASQTEAASHPGFSHSVFSKTRQRAAWK